MRQFVGLYALHGFELLFAQ